jgi:hypothetical protein
MESLPFKNSAYEGFGVVEGRVRLALDTLVIEYQVKDNVFGAFKSELKTVAIPLDKLEAVRYKPARLRRPTLEVDVTDASVIEKIPGSMVGTLPLKLTRAARTHAQAVVRRIEHRLADHRLLNDNRDLSERDVDFLFGGDDQ